MTIQILSLFVAVITIGIWAFFKIWKRNKYTRERYAFFSSVLVVNLFVFSIYQIYSEPIFITFINYALEYFDKPIIEGFQLGFSDKLLIWIVYVWIVYYFYKLYEKWNLPTSARQHELSMLSQETNYLNEAWFAITHWNTLQLYNSQDLLNEKLDIRETEIQHLTWHVQVAELLALYSKQYHIDVEKDWYEQEHCFISSYGQAHSPLAILCRQEASIAKIEEFIKFAQKNHKSDEARYVVAIKEGDIDKVEKTKSGVEYRIVSEKRLLDELIDFQGYFQFIKKNYETIPIMDGYKYAIKDVYVEPECLVRESKDTELVPNSIEDYIIDWANDPKDKKQIALLGEYGQGKSVLSQRIAYRLIQNPELSERIPIIIELRGKFPKSYQSTLNFFLDWCAPYSINPKALLKLYYAGKLLLIFEGFDEIEMVGDRQVRMEHFRSIWECSTSNSKIIITGRPNYFSNDREQKVFLRSQETEFTRQYCKEIFIQKFDKQRVTNVLRNFPEDIKAEILSVWNHQNENSSFIDLISRPSSLFLTAAIWKDRDLSSLKENLNSSTIIQEFLIHCYDRQEQKMNKEVILSRNERAYFMQGIAIGMTMMNKYTNQISEGQLKGLVKKLIDNFPDKISENNIESYDRKLKRRYNSKYNEDDILLDIRTCGVLVRDTMTIDTFKFAHKSFLELLVSKYYVIYLFQDKYQQDDLDLISYRAIKKTFSVVEDEIPQTSDVFQFIIEQCTRDLKFDTEISSKEKVNVIFKKICHFNLNVNTYCKLMYLFGADIRIGSLTFIGIVIMIGLPVFAGIMDPRSLPFNESMMMFNYIFYGTFVAYLLAFYYRVIIHRRFNHIILLAAIPLLVERIFVRANLHNTFLPKYNRLLMFYVICERYNLLPLLEAMMPKFAFKELTKSSKKMEKRFNGEDKFE